MMIRALKPPFALKYRLQLLTALLAGLLFFQFAVAQGVRSDAPEPSVRIAQDLKLIQEGEQLGLPAAKMGYLWAILAAAYQDSADSGDAGKALEAYERALGLLGKDPAARSNYATTLDNLGSLYLESKRVEEAATVRQKALTIRKSLGDPMGIAISEGHMAEVELSQHRFKDAEKDSLAAYATLSATTGHPDADAEFSALVTLIYAQCMQPKCGEGMRNAEKMLALVEKAYPPESVERAHVSMALGFAQWKTGATEEAERSMQEGLRIMRARLGEHSPILMAAMFQYRDYLKAMHRKPEVKALDRKLADMKPPEPDASCMGCTVSVHALR